MNAVSDRYTIDTLPDKYKKLHVLIVDDDPLMRKVIAKVLTECLISDIHSVSSATEAIQYINSNLANLLIVDLVMKDMNGLEFVREVRMGKTSLPKNTPIIISTALAERQILETAIQLDINGYIVKTDGMTNMGKKITGALEKRITLKRNDDYEKIDTNIV